MPFSAIKILLRMHPMLHKIAKTIRGDYILLDYPSNSTPRYGHGNLPHHQIFEIINKNRNHYGKLLSSFLIFKDDFLKIPRTINHFSLEPRWINYNIPGLDTVALYSFLSINQPQQYFEIGSGFSTMFARKAITDHKLPTKITSIDPLPRASIDSICDNIIRKPLEDIDLNLFDELGSGDFLFIDGSHRCYMNSDVTVMFLDILPMLKPGVIVEFHDILLPYDYPLEWVDRFYSEQYLLATFLLANSDRYNVILPCAFISFDSELSSILKSLWSQPEMSSVETHGVSFWIEIK